MQTNLSRNRYVCEVLPLEAMPFLQGILGVIFPQDEARPDVAITGRDFSLAEHKQLLPRPAYSPDISPIEHAGTWMVDVSLVIRVLQLKKISFKLWLRIQAIWNSLPQADI